MKYACTKCGLTFKNRRDADTHENKLGHKVELRTGETYWGAHLVAV